MSTENSIKFVFNSSYEFVSYEINGDMTLYTAPENFIGKNVKEVLPENVAATTIIFIDKCLETGLDQEYDYDLGEDKYHSVLTKMDNNVMAVITKAIK